MKISDRIYGVFDIKEPILLELLASKSIKRLKRISQFGVPNQLYHISGYSRYEHSVGVMLLLRKLGALLEEQVAGLIHDVSHTAFSHVIDWVFFTNKKEDFQDKILKSKIMKSEINKILSKYKIKIKDFEEYHLLETKIPFLCADRIDYALREFLDRWGINLVNNILNSLIVYKNQIIFCSKGVAKTFGELFLRCQMEHWGSEETMIRYKLLSEIIKIALRERIILKKDLFQDEKMVLKKINSAKSENIKNLLRLLEKGFVIVPNLKNPMIKEKKKFRYVDPYYIKKGRILSLVEIDKEYRKKIAKNKKINLKGISVDFFLK